MGVLFCLSLFCQSPLGGAGGGAGDGLILIFPAAVTVNMNFRHHADGNPRCSAMPHEAGTLL